MMLLWGQRYLAQRYSAPRRKLSLLRSASIRCCRSTIAFMPSKRPSRISRDRRCIDCSSATRSAGFLRSKARLGARRRSSGTRSATSTSISLKCALKKANFACLSRLTAHRSCAQLQEKANRHTATAFLKALIAVVPYKIHTILTDNGIQFCDLPKNRSGPTARWQTHMFDLLCRAHGIEHRLTKPNHPWTNGQVERMNRTLKEATVRRYHYDSHHQLRQHIQTFLDAYNFAKRLKTLNGLTPFESVCKAWTKEPNRFKYDPVQLSSELHT